MKILINIPMDDYNNFLQHCDATRPEYELLKNGAITRDRQQRRGVEILCEVDDAKGILELANAIYPDVVPHVQESISLARRLQSPKKTSEARRGA
jgi:hypothetical protein